MVKKTNFILQFSLDNDSASKSFFSSKDMKYLFNQIKKSACETSGGVTKKMKVKLVQTIGDKKSYKTKYFDVSIDEPKKCFEQIKKSLLKCDKIDDMKDNRYRINIGNCSSPRSDIKGFSIVCNDNIDQVAEKLKALLDKIIKEEDDPSIVFSEKNKTSSHRVIIHKSGSSENYKISRGFSIKLPNFSSSEVCDRLIKNIRGKGR